MATRENRIADFNTEQPPAGEPLHLLCEDHCGTYLIPYPCRWTDGAWRNLATGDQIQATVLGWRAPRA